MSVYPCSFCRMRRPGKLASCYWAWFDAGGNRQAFKCRYCPDCATVHLVALLKKLREGVQWEDVLACLGCGANVGEDSDPIYLTVYLPKLEPEEYALQLESACAAQMRIPVVEHGERLPDRGGVVRGPSPSTSSWDAIGLGQ